MTGYTDRLPTCGGTKVDLDRVSRLDVGLRRVVRLDALLDGRWIAYRLCSISFYIYTCPFAHLINSNQIYD